MVADVLIRNVQAHRRVEIFEHQGEHAQAKEHHERALEIFETVLGAEHPDVAAPRIGLASVVLTLGDPEAARAHAERAASICEAAAVAPEVLAKTRFVLTQATPTWGPLPTLVAKTIPAATDPDTGCSQTARPRPRAGPRPEPPHRDLEAIERDDRVTYSECLRGPWIMRARVQ